MAKKWYPVIDYTRCTECGTCIKKCSHGVYDPDKAPCPVVVRPNSCLDGCHGCGTLCPQGAITYVGDNTGWHPPNTKPSETGTNRAPAVTKNIRPIVIDFLYLDLNTCERCMAADTVLHEAAADLSGVLHTLGYKMTVNSVNITSAKMAEQYRFLSSPTVRVNGRDICLTVEENKCTCCGNICGSDINCRMFTYKGKKYDHPPKAMMMYHILKAVYCRKKTTVQESYKLPANLKKFFQSKQLKQ